MADSILRLKVESQEYDAKLKRAADGLQRYVDNCRKVGGTLQMVEKDTLDFVKAIGQMETTSRTATGKLNEMKKSFVEFSAQYRSMTEQEKASPFGKALSQSLDQLKVRIKDAQKDLQSINQEMSGSKFGQLGGVLDSLGSKLGVTGNLTEMLTSKTAMLTGAVGASVAIIGKATEAWASYNTELAKQDQITQVTTGLKDANANRMTDEVRALVDTYGVDFREAINAANTFMAQFGKTGDEAIQLLRDGMQGMIQGDGPKLLSMIQQFAPAFRDAGISADQLVAIIHNSEGGLFSEQNMNAILMGIKNIRLMTKSTSDALAQLGIDGQEMSRKMSDGSMTVFEALHKVATAIEGCKAGSREAGQVMQYVFGRQGAMQGMKLGRAIAELNTNLEDTKRQTGDVGQAYDELYQANVKLNTAIRDCFEYDGWDKMAKGIQSKLVTALANVIQMIADIKRELGGGWDTPKSQTINDKKTGGGNRIDELVKSLGTGSTTGQQRMFENQMNAYTSYALRQRQEKERLIAEANSDTSGETWRLSERKIRELENNAKAAEKNRDEYMRRANELFLKGSGKTFNGREWVQVAKPVADTDTKITPITPTKPTGGGGGGGGHVDLTPAQQAAADVEKALQGYAATISSAQAKMDASMITSTEYDKQINRGQQQLAEAYLKAYNATGDEKYLAAFKGTADDYNKLRATIEENATAQKEQAEAAKKLTDAQRKLAEAQKAMSDAQKSGDLKGYYKAQEQMQTAQATVDRIQAENPTLSKSKEQTVRYIMEVNDDQLKKLRELAIDDKTIKVNVEQGKVDLPDVQNKTYTVTIDADTAEAQSKVDAAVTGWNAEKVTIPVTIQTVRYTMEVNDDQLKKLRELAIDDKTIKVNVEHGKVDLPDVQDKTYTVTIDADTAEAQSKVDAAVTGWNAEKVTIPITIQTAPEIGKAVWDTLPQQVQQQVRNIAVSVPMKFDLTQDNIAAFIGNLDDQIKNAPFGSTLFQNLTAQMADANTLKSLMEVAMQNGIDTAEFDPQQFWQKIFGENPGDYISDETWQEVINKINKKLKEIGKKPIKIDFLTGKGSTDGKKDDDGKRAIDVADKMVGGIKSLTSNLEALGVEIPQGFKDVVSGVENVLGVLNSIAVIVEAIQAVDSITSWLPWANGGVVHAANGFVPGNNMSGDMIPSMLNSGELVLNKAQQGNLASQLEGGGMMGNLNLTATISGEQIRLALNNNGRRTGHGEYVQSNRRRA